MSGDPGLACQELVELVTDHLEGRLPAAEAARLEAHLLECPGCVAYVEQMKLLLRLGAEAREPEVHRLAEQLLPAFRSYRRGLA